MNTSQLSAAVYHGSDATIGGVSLLYSNTVKLNTARVQVRLAALEVWQKRWSSSGKGRQTYRIFPDVTHRLTMSWFDANMSHVTNLFVTGNGPFKYKLHSLGLASSPACTCGSLE